MGKLGCFLLRGFRLLVPLLLNSSLLDHDAVPLHQAGAQHSQSPIDAVMSGDEVILEPPRSRRCSILLTFEKVDELGHCEFTPDQPTSSSLAALAGGGVFPEARYNSGSHVVAGVRYIAKLTTFEALFSCRRAA
jgi:hypothetical protein